MNKEQTAFERLFKKIKEITAIMKNSDDKKSAVKNIKSEFPEFQDMSDNTIEQEIKSFPFILTLITELETIKQELNNKKNELFNGKRQLNKNMDLIKIESFMKETEQRFVELNNRIKQLETTKQDIKQNKQSIKQRGLNNVGKWNVVENGGYYRAFRNVKGKNIGVYLGKQFDEQIAREKITGKGYQID